MMRALLLGVLTTTLIACDDDDGGADSDAATPLDAAVTDGGTSDVTTGDMTTGDAADSDAAATDGPVDNPLPVAADVAGDFCADVCGSLDGCDDLAAVGGDAAACRAACETSAAENGLWLGGYACFAASCDAGCLDGPLAPAAVCEQTCERLDGCGALGLFELPDGEPNLCRAACAGALEADPELDALLMCVSDALGDGCDEPQARVAGCFDDGPGICRGFCEDLLSDGDGEESCGPDTALRQAWATVDACVAACEVLGSVQQPMLAGCVFVSECADPAPCLELPDAPDAACGEACEALYALCDEIEDFPPEEMCPGVCTGFLVGLGVDAGAEDAGDCVRSVEACPGDGGDQVGGVLIGCALPASAACGRVCGAIAACSPDPEDRIGCRLGCRQAELDMPEVVVEVDACVMAAGDDCQGIQACIPSGDACPDRSRDPIVAGGRRSFGECLGDCWFDLSVGEAADGGEACDTVALRICEPGGGACRVTNTGVLTGEGHAAARALAGALVDVPLEPRYGCPDCADGGAGVVTLLRDGQLTEHEYELGEPPAVLAAAAVWTQSLIDALRTCRSGAVVDVGPGCVPAE